MNRNTSRINDNVIIVKTEYSESGTITVRDSELYQFP